MSKQRVIPFIGGEWHGEGYEASVLPQKVLTNVGMPPRYIGNDQYDAFVSHLGHEAYYLKVYEEKFYYVAESWAEDFPANIDTPHETSNGKRMREEKERHERVLRKAAEETAKSMLFIAIVKKHNFLDTRKTGLREPDEMFESERKLWKDFQDMHTLYIEYDGEPPMTKERLKV